MYYKCDMCYTSENKEGMCISQSTGIKYIM